MSTIILDTLEFADKLKAGGFTDQQAEAQARAIADLVEKQLATQQQVAEHESTIQRDIKESENRLEARIKELDFRIEALRGETKRDNAEVRQTIAETKAELVRWVVGVGILQFALIAALLLKLAYRI